MSSALRAPKTAAPESNTQDIPQTENPTTAETARATDIEIGGEIRNTPIKIIAAKIGVKARIANIFTREREKVIQVAFPRNKKIPKTSGNKKMAEREGFEPPVPCGTPDFESGTIGHSVISPWLKWRANKKRSRRASQCIFNGVKDY